MAFVRSQQPWPWVQEDVWTKFEEIPQMTSWYMTWYIAFTRMGCTDRQPENMMPPSTSVAGTEAQKSAYLNAEVTDQCRHSAWLCGHPDAHCHSKPILNQIYWKCAPEEISTKKEWQCWHVAYRCVFKQANKKPTTNSYSQLSWKDSCNILNVS